MAPVRHTDRGIELMSKHKRLLPTALKSECECRPSECKHTLLLKP